MKKGTHMSAISLQKMSIAQKKIGNKPPNMGGWNKGIKRHWSSPTEFKKGIHYNISTEFKKGEMSQKMLGNKNAPTGERHHSWKGGIDPKFKKKHAPRPKPDYCEICGATSRICFDHDHTTGQFRGWICGNCNSALGFIKDNVKTLALMIDYLKK